MMKRMLGKGMREEGELMVRGLEGMEEGGNGK
jgi:hypothetical protein